MAAFQSAGTQPAPSSRPQHFSCSSPLHLALPAELAFHQLAAVTVLGGFSSSKQLFASPLQGLHIWPKYLWMPGRWVTFKAGCLGNT